MLLLLKYDDNNNIPNEIPLVGSSEDKSVCRFYHYLMEIEKLFLKDPLFKCISSKYRRKNNRCNIAAKMKSNVNTTR